MSRRTERQTAESTGCCAFEYRRTRTDHRTGTSKGSRSIGQGTCIEIGTIVKRLPATKAMTRLCCNSAVVNVKTRRKPLGANQRAIIRVGDRPDASIISAIYRNVGIPRLGTANALYVQSCAVQDGLYAGSGQGVSKTNTPSPHPNRYYFRDCRTPCTNTLRLVVVSYIFSKNFCGNLRTQRGCIRRAGHRGGRERWGIQIA